MAGYVFRIAWRWRLVSTFISSFQSDDSSAPCETDEFIVKSNATGSSAHQQNRWLVAGTRTLLRQGAFRRGVCYRVAGIEDRPDNEPSKTNDDQGRLEILKEVSVRFEHRRKLGSLQWAVKFKSGRPNLNNGQKLVLDRLRPACGSMEVGRAKARRALVGPIIGYSSAAMIVENGETGTVTSGSACRKLLQRYCNSFYTRRTVSCRKQQRDGEERRSTGPSNAYAVFDVFSLRKEQWGSQQRM